MITLKQWMELVDYRITEGSDGGYPEFSDNIHSLSAWNGDHDGWSFNVVFGTRDQTVYMVEACDYKNQRAYRMIHPDYEKDYKQSMQEEWRNQAWDDVNFTDLEVDEDWLEKATAIIAGEVYDSRVKVPVEFSDEELLTYMKLAHERDITFNQLIEEALRHAIEEYERDPEGMKQRAKAFKDGTL